MKFCFVVFALFLSSPTFAAGGFGEKKLKDKVLVDILTLAKVEDINKLKRMLGSKLNYRLYALPKQGTCVSETHVVCSSHYYLAVNEFDEYPNRTVYDLGEHGEIINFSYNKPIGNDPKQDTDTIYFHVLKYPTSVIKMNPQLKQVKVLYGGDISISAFGISSVPSVK